MILHGKDGEVLWNPVGEIGSPANLVPIAHVNSFKLSLKTEKVKVTCFQDSNHVYVPGLPDISGSFGAIFDSDELTLIAASQAQTPGLLKLVPHTSEADTYFLGAAYLDADLDTGVEQAPKMSSSFVAGGSWLLPSAGSA